MGINVRGVVEGSPHEDREVRHSRHLDPVRGDRRGCRRCRSSSGSPTTTARRPTRIAARRDLEVWTRRQPVPGGEPAARVDRGRSTAGSSARPTREARRSARRASRSARRPSPSPGVTCPSDPAGARRSARARCSFVQTAGGRMGLPAPRRVRPAQPFLQMASATAWTTLELVAPPPTARRTRAADRLPAPSRATGSTTTTGTLVEKRGASTSSAGGAQSHRPSTPWGGEDSPAPDRGRGSRSWSASCRTCSSAARGGSNGGRYRRARSWSNSTTTGTELFAGARRRCWTPRWTARSSPRSGRARSSASTRRSRAAAGPRRSARRHAAASSWSRSTSSTRTPWRPSRPGGAREAGS